MSRELQITADGSHTLFIPEMNEHYHSVNGAAQESMHIFINAGLRSLDKPVVRIMEVGFGTGLNALLSLRESVETGRKIEYYSAELYPLGDDIVSKLNYGELLWSEGAHFFKELHSAPWNECVDITDSFTLCKIEGDIAKCDIPENIDLIYFDAFAPEKQPEMWNEEIYRRLASHTNDGGVIVTYCAKGDVRRGMQAAGFKMERLPGPPGKRHILRGVLSCE